MSQFFVRTNKSLNLGFTKPIGQEMVFEIDFSQLNPKKMDDIDKVYLISKEGWLKSTLYDFHSQKQVLNRFSIGAMMLSEPVIEVIRRELRKMSPDMKITAEQVSTFTLKFM